MNEKRKAMRPIVSRVLLSVAVVAGVTLGGPIAGTAHAAATAMPRTTVVLVHGAFADGSGWNKVIPLLQGRGLNVVSIQNPLTSLADDVAATRRVLDAQHGPVVLVGHSWGGVVISEAGAHESVRSLVYVAALAPSEGQSVADLTEGYPVAPGSKYLVQDKDGFLTLSPEGVAKHFGQDLPAAETRLMTVTQGPIRASAFGEKVKHAAWRDRPTWFVLTQRDHMIDPGLQQAMARSISAHVVSLPTSHVPQLSKPAQVAQVIIDAAAPQAGR